MYAINSKGLATKKGDILPLLLVGVLKKTKLLSHSEISLYTYFTNHISFVHYLQTTIIIVSKTILYYCITKLSKKKKVDSISYPVPGSHLKLTSLYNFYLNLSLVFFLRVGVGIKFFTRLYSKK